MATKTYTTDEIVNMLKTSNYAVERAILAIYERQTADEQAAQKTDKNNGVGFSGFDAKIFSSFAQQIMANKYNKGNGLRLSPKQFEVARKLDKNGNMKIGRYAKQLAGIANANTAAQAA